jgi:exodeoxyribonuclease VII small subunit
MEHDRDAAADVADLSFEQARDELVRGRRTRAGRPTLEQSLALWTRGEALAAREEWLLGAKRCSMPPARADAMRGQ